MSWSSVLTQFVNLSRSHLHSLSRSFSLFAGMAICDMLTVLFPAPGLWYMYTFGNHYKPMHPVSMCLAYSIFNEVSQQKSPNNSYKKKKKGKKK